MHDWKTKLHEAIPNLTVKENELLAPYTTVKIGGVAELLAEPKSTQELIETLQVASKLGIPITMLGWGANTLIADRGISGLVIRPNNQEITISDDPEKIAEALLLLPDKTTDPRWSKGSDDNAHADFSNVAYQETGERVLVTMAAGVALPQAINQLINQGITGLQWFSRIPATMGGAVYNNIHGGTHYIGEYVSRVAVFTTTGATDKLPHKNLEFGYDYSRFHHSNEVILEAELLLYRGDTERARSTVTAWAKQKAMQPPKSLGCIFQNLTHDEQIRLKLPTPSIGYLIEHVLELKGFQIGDAQVSLKHAAFIENTGAATAADYLSVIKHVAKKAQERCQLTLKPEIFFHGFTPQELADIAL